MKGNFVKLVWKDSFCCGNQQIDAQHHALFHLANELLEAVLSARPAPEITAVITRLLADSRHHFRDEEIILRSVNFPGLTQHAAEHAKLLANGLNLAQEFEASTLTVGKVFQFLASELVVGHMLKVDREYFPFINKSSADHPDVMNCP
jgi:hemerythrin